MLETLRDDVTLLFYHIPKVLCPSQIWRLWRAFRYTEQFGMFKKCHAEFWPCYPNVTEIETHGTRLCFSSHLLSHFSEPVQVLCSQLIGVKPRVMFCCCSTPPLRFDMLSIQRCSVCFGCSGWLFEVLLSSYQLEAVWLFSSDLWHQWGIFNLRSAVRRIFCPFFGPVFEMVV